MGDKRLIRNVDCSKGDDGCPVARSQIMPVGYPTSSQSVDMAAVAAAAVAALSFHPCSRCHDASIQL